LPEITTMVMPAPAEVLSEVFEEVVEVATHAVHTATDIVHAAPASSTQPPTAQQIKAAGRRARQFGSMRVEYLPRSAAGVPRTPPPLDAVAKLRRGLLSFDEEQQLIEKFMHLPAPPTLRERDIRQLFRRLPGCFLIAKVALSVVGALVAALLLIAFAAMLAFISLVLPPWFVTERVLPASHSLLMRIFRRRIEVFNDKIQATVHTSKVIVPATCHDRNSDPRRQVQVRVQIEHLWDINSSHHYFHADVLLEAGWVADESLEEWLEHLQQPSDWLGEMPEDERLKWVAIEVQEALNKRQLEYVWKPDLFFGNLVEVHEEAMRNVVFGEMYEKWYRVKITEWGHLRILERVRVVGDFSELYELQYFPADRQALTVEVRSKQEPHLVHLSLPDDYKTTGGSAEINAEMFVHTGSWTLSNRLRIWETRSLPSETLNLPARTYPQLRINMRAVRKFTQYIADVFVPQAILSLSATSSLLVPRSALGERLAITLTMVLASIAFKSQVHETIPSVSYSTMTDKCTVHELLNPLPALARRACAHAICACVGATA